MNCRFRAGFCANSIFVSFKHLSDAHHYYGHEFQDKSVSHFDRPEDDSVYGLFSHCPMVRFFRSIKLPKFRVSP
jgi:hypothetical protein